MCTTNKRLVSKRKKKCFISIYLLFQNLVVIFCVNCFFYSQTKYSGTCVKTTNKYDGLKHMEQKWFLDGMYACIEIELCWIRYAIFFGKDCAFPKEIRKCKRPQGTLCWSLGKCVYVHQIWKSDKIKRNLLHKSFNNVRRRFRYRSHRIRRLYFYFFQYVRRSNCSRKQCNVTLLFWLSYHT